MEEAILKRAIQKFMPIYSRIRCEFIQAKKQQFQTKVYARARTRRWSVEEEGGSMCLFYNTAY